VAVEFRLLGDVQVLVDGCLVDVGHARQRCVLVALLVEANRPVPVDQLVERVWADRPPQRARNTVSGYLSRLRDALATGGAAIVRQPAGHVLTVDPMAVDVHRYRRLVAQARAADDDENAIALFGQALGLWRGEPFATLDTPWLRDVRDGLLAERLAAELDRNDLALGRGQHARLLGELGAAAAAHPLDERLAGQLMLALYRCGRQAEALRGYEQIRRGLAEELGVDPSPALRGLYQQILTADAALAAPTPSITRPGRATPMPPVAPVVRQLPAPPPSFAGRAAQLSRLDALLPAASGRGATVVISALAGTAGVGKTALALHWAHQVADRFGDGQLYVNLRGFDPGGQVMDPAEAIRRFLDALGVPAQRIPADPHAQAALYRSQLAGRRMLIVLDNARDTAQVRPLLPGTATCLVLVTSRNQLTGLVAAEGAHPISLDLLTLDEARQLLAGRLGADRLAAEPDAVGEIITACARLPIALAIAAARAATHPHLPLHTLAGELRTSADRLATLSTDDPHTDVRAVFSWSYHTLTPAAARLFRLLGLHPGPDIATPAAASLAGVPPTQVRPLLAELTGANLLVEPTPGRYTFHDLLRAYATDLTHHTDPDQQRHAATGRILDHYLHTAHTADRLLRPARDPIALPPPQPGATPEQPADHQQALEWFIAEHAVLLAAVDHAAATGLDTHTWQLAWTLRTVHDRLGRWHDQVATGHAAVAAAERLADPTAQARAHRILALAYSRLGDYDNAQTHLRHGLDLYRQAGDAVGQAHTHLSLSYAWERRGRYTEALENARHAVDLFRAAGHRHGQANALNSVGWYHTNLGDHRQALTTCQQALTLLQELDDRDGQADTWDSLGYAHHHLGHHTQAIACYQQAINLSRDLGDRYDEASILTHLGDTHHAAGNPHAARTAWQQALTILDQLEHPDADTVRAKLHDLDRTTPEGEEDDPG
jgi:DNA-binding SARP family transcriptional activator/Tfp pilus assembly protein PilF